MLKRIDRRFKAALKPRFNLAALEREPASVIGLWPDSRVAYVNKAWIAFAEKNSGNPTISEHWGIGSRYLDAIAEPLQPFYQRLFERALEANDSLHPISHQYECSSAKLFREFNMQVYSLADQQGFVIVNSLVVERPQDPTERPAHVGDATHYLRPNGTMLQCAHCRRMQSAENPARWDWVPEWVEQSPPNTSHGICEVCAAYYYADEQY
ncbi:MAG: hypothetical protein ABJC26_14525 [Gemmatimonadaceae bacterium]